MRQFEFPYNFDKELIKCLRVLDPLGITIDCIYMPPYLADYKTFFRNPESKQQIESMTRFEYEDHIKFINSMFPGKIQILLQKKELLLPKNKINYYLSFGITKFCVASIEQAKIIKDINPNVSIVGSISMAINKEKIEQDFDEYKKYFNSFVLPFSACRCLHEIKDLPQDFSYILLVNGYCNVNCKGIHHWSSTYESENGKPRKPVPCPGLLSSKPDTISWD